MEPVISSNTRRIYNTIKQKEPLLLEQPSKACTAYGSGLEHFTELADFVYNMQKDIASL
jgi:hypothetical protein